MDDLRDEFNKEFPSSGVTFINGYNPSHLAGLGDLAQAGAQMMGKSISNFDRDTILLQIYPQITTRKLLLVGHSQGAFYSNVLYDYLLAHGEPKAAVGVYQVGSPASTVAGTGRYLNSSGDAMLSTLRELGFKFLANNIDLVASPDDAQKTFPGHSFSGAYLAEAPERVVGDIQSTLKGLKAEWASETGECFTAPDSGLGYQTVKAGFAVADTAATGIRVGVGAAQVAAVAASNVLASVVQSSYGLATKVAADIGITVGGVAGISHAAEPKSQPTNFDILSKLYGSSLTRDEYKDLLGSAVATAPIFAGEPVVKEAQPEEVEASKKITYLGGHSHKDGAGDDEQQEVVPEQPAPEPEITQESEPQPEPEPAPEPEPEPEPQAPIYSLVFEDSFDAYNSKGWQTPDDIFSGSLIPFDLESADSALCHNSSCVIGRGGLGGFGSPSHRPYIHKNIGVSSAGYLTVWAKRQDAWGQVNADVAVCVTGTSCWGAFWNRLPMPNDNEWHQYLFAWRPGTEAVQACVQRDSTDLSSCPWGDIAGTDASTTFDIIGLTGFTPRSDLGDKVWFDDLSIYISNI